MRENPDFSVDDFCDTFVESIRAHANYFEFFSDADVVQRVGCGDFKVFLTRLHTYIIDAACSAKLYVLASDRGSVFNELAAVANNK